MGLLQYTPPYIIYKWVKRGVILAIPIIIIAGPPIAKGVGKAASAVGNGITAVAKVPGKVGSAVVNSPPVTATVGGVVLVAKVVYGECLPLPVQRSTRGQSDYSYWPLPPGAY